MLKKILYIAVAVIIGLIFALATYMSAYYDALGKFVNDALEKKDYITLNRPFSPFFDANEVFKEGDNPHILIYRGTTLVTKKIEDEDYQVVANAFNVLFVNIEGIKFDDVKISDTEYDNYCSFIVSNGTEEYEYYMRDFIKNTSNTNFILISIPILDIKEKFTENITNIIFLDSHGQIVSDYQTDISLDAPFFSKTSELIGKYEEYVVTKDSEEFNSFYEPWLESFEEVDGYTTGIETSQMIPSSSFYKVWIYIGIYICIVIVIGYFIFRRKKDKLLFTSQNN